MLSISISNNDYQSAIGVLTSADMDHFATIFVNFQKRGKTKTKEGTWTYPHNATAFSFAHRGRSCKQDTRSVDVRRLPREVESQIWTHSVFCQVRYPTQDTQLRFPDACARCVGVFDTVGALGLPQELQFGHVKPMSPIFGFPDRLLSPDVEHAFQALAINETRADFVSEGVSIRQPILLNFLQKCCKFEQTEEGRKKGQVLRQVRPSATVH